jgi:hypothetical protein
MVINPFVHGPKVENDSNPLGKIVSMSTIFNNIFSLMLKCMIDFGGLGLEELGRKLVNKGCDM